MNKSKMEDKKPHVWNHVMMGWMQKQHCVAFILTSTSVFVMQFQTHKKEDQY